MLSTPGTDFTSWAVTGVYKFTFHNLLAPTNSSHLPAKDDGDPINIREEL